MVVDEVCAELRFERVHEQLWVSIQEPVRRVASVLVHCGQHQQAEIVHASALSSFSQFKRVKQRAIAGFRRLPSYHKRESSGE